MWYGKLAWYLYRWNIFGQFWRYVRGPCVLAVQAIMLVGHVFWQFWRCVSGSCISAVVAICWWCLFVYNIIMCGSSGNMVIENDTYIERECRLAVLAICWWFTCTINISTYRHNWQNTLHLRITIQHQRIAKTTKRHYTYISIMLRFHIARTANIRSY